MSKRERRHKVRRRASRAAKTGLALGGIAGLGSVGVAVRAECDATEVAAIPEGRPAMLTAEDLGPNIREVSLVSPSKPFMFRKVLLDCAEQGHEEPNPDPTPLSTVTVSFATTMLTGGSAVASQYLDSSGTILPS